ncbi:polysulfide reductase [Desulfitobacterium dehalogenans ATCC 51507]|uniref:Polysulfide reductase n=1 Tax=Desulfitobacterium dehalogenans (strain ATCC 51507 / DSM 9161 / JW/IU-DC1) TaxID=756499 RepID=I4A8G2_DESDJ|nr:NrfD/PsrC family molybdoenzyme membrane anchor subunit [Desulfitobacterium dehalogenans]AFM00247.1 polysulfide reductase [Desulfitobacterium dehalogenans ATCC 51507]
MNITEDINLPKSFFVPAVILAIVGICTWIFQLVSGMQVTGLDQGVVWGLYIAAFFAAVGGGAALLAIVGISEFKNILSPVAKSKTLILAMTAFIIGGILITMDLGNPVQMLRLITSFRFQSMMVWDFWFLALCFLAALFFLLKVRKSGNGGKTFGVIAIAAALLVVIVEGFMLSSMAAHSMWGSGITVVSFLISAAIMGCALAMLIMPQNDSIRKILQTVLILSLIVTLAEVFTGALTGNPETKSEMMFVLSGKAAPFFWIQLIIGLLVPLYLLIKCNKPIAVALLAAIGVVFEKIWVLAAGQASHWMQESLNAYFPSLIEYITVIGAAAIGVLLFVLLMKLFNGKVSTASKNQNMQAI